MFTAGDHIFVFRQPSELSRPDFPRAGPLRGLTSARIRIIHPPPPQNALKSGLPRQFAFATSYSLFLPDIEVVQVPS